MKGSGLIALAFGAVVAYAIVRGKFPLRRPLGSVSRAKYPVAFWLLVATFSGVAVYLMVLEIRAWLSVD